MIWSDDEIREFASKFVCVIDECFDLHPPKWLKDEWLESPKSTALFRKFTRNAPNMWGANSSTHQGFYCLTADGDYLSGNFGRTSNGRARELLNTAWNKFQTLAANRGWDPKPIPNNRFEMTMGKPVQPGGIKLEAASRDLPRGSDRRPGNSEWEREAYNLNWIDFTPNEAAYFVTESKERVEIPRKIVEKLAITTIKDNVRGQSGWKKGAFSDGELYTELIRSNGKSQSMWLTGFAILRDGRQVIATQLHGHVEFDSERGEFTRFDMVASGQRQGSTQFNFRHNDPGPAPLGIAWTLHQPDN